jgi:hypothetical protein
MKTTKFFFIVVMLVVFACGRSNAQTKHGYVVEPNFVFYMDCNGVTNKLTGAIEKHFWWHLDKDGIAVWDKSNVKCEQLVSVTTGEVFKIRYEFSETHISGEVIDYTLNYTFIGNNGTRFLLKQKWEYIDGVETLIKENKKCLE